MIDDLFGKQHICHVRCASFPQHISDIVLLHIIIFTIQLLWSYEYM